MTAPTSASSRLIRMFVVRSGDAVTRDLDDPGVLDHRERQARNALSAELRVDEVVDFVGAWSKNLTARRTRRRSRVTRCRSVTFMR